MTESWLGRILELEVGPVAHGGHCVSRVDGRVLFVRHALPGERVRAEVTEDKGGSFCRADAIEVLSGSEHRVTPPCPLAAPGGCGGCDWQHAEPAYQRELKAAVVAEQLQRLAGITREVVVEPLEGGPLGWRSRVRLVAGRDGQAGLRAHHSHRVIPIDDCPIAVPGSLDTALSKRWRPGTELEVTSDGDNHLHLRELATVRGRTQGKQLSGGMAIQHAAGRDWRLDAHGFWQVHPHAADTLAELVREWADAPRGGVAWDLYAGVGLFASVLAEQVGPDGQVLAIESGRRAVSDGERNLSDLPQVSWRSGRVEHLIGDAPTPVDVVVLDPPRKGAGRDVVNAIAAGEPDRIVYVACDPAALARDVQFFSEHGYSLTDLRAFDAFPMTHHVECVALLQ
ncbi:23S rRNA m(5)U-1939 methyltransferase [Amycolatopsis echigonensis]|uniref:23S rRNA m(5)U-1939 methyltransferase n=1 Tax=Amycolatopsis echigonensis TaxID=2576905 RepID=A0A2N3W9B7_9PSEU|nr:class I SAM-dependent RNA methyltransferase [Amycolatopsis niigatensis]PKV90463.1 23S rRNA m(5)U-1939 methyltransferase [Amycolatopsis niigatensis]